MEIRLNICGNEQCFNLTSYGKDVISFGKSPECDISISKDFVGDLQGCFYLENGKWYIKNLGESHSILLYRFNSSDNKTIDSEELNTNSFYMIRGRNDLDSVRIYVNNQGIKKQKSNDDNKTGKTSTGKKKDKTNIIIIALIGMIFAVTITIGIIMIVKSKDDSSGGGGGSIGGSGHLSTENGGNTGDASSEDSSTGTEDMTGTDTEESDGVEYMDKDEFIEYLKENDIDTDSDKYYRENSEVISVVKADEADTVLSEADVCGKLDALGFGKEGITANYTVDGKYYDSTEISEESDKKHPMYQALYASSAEEMWSIIVINDVILANPVSYNMEYEPDVQVIFSEKDTVMSYDYLSNSFYETIPKETELKVIKINKISAEELDKLTVEEIDKLVK